MELRAIKQYYEDKQVVLLADDVLSIVRQVRELYGDKVKISWEPTTGWYVFSEMCEDKTERLIFTCEELDGRALERLRRSDSQARTYQDPYLAAENAQDQAHAEQDAQYAAYINEAGEHLIHAMKRDGMAPRLPSQVSLHIPERDDD